VDFEKAFDKVWRDGLWCKLLSSSISKSSVIDVRPLTFRSFKNCSRSFKYIEKRKGERFSPCRTNIFVLYAFFELLKLKKKKLFVIFVDFEKAFDKVWRDGLWCKLLLNNINGKMYKVKTAQNRDRTNIFRV
jgi:hypothetical protein